MTKARSAVLILLVTLWTTGAAHGGRAASEPVAPLLHLPPWGGHAARVLQPGQRLPGHEIVILAKHPAPGNFIVRPGIDDQALGPVTAPGKSVTLATTLRLADEIPAVYRRDPVHGDALAAAFVEDIEAAGFWVVHAPTHNPLHLRIIPHTHQFDAEGRELLALAFDLLERYLLPKTLRLPPVSL